MDIIFTGLPITRYVTMTMTDTPQGFSSTQLVDRWGNQVQRAVGRVLAESANMGVLNLINPSATVGFTFIANDVIVLEGYDNIKNALFHQKSGAGTIDWLLQTAKA